MTSILFNLLKETFLALAARIAFRTIAERFMTRLVIYGLKKLKDYSDNDVVDETVQDIIDQLKGKRLKVARQSVFFLRGRPCLQLQVFRH